MHINVRLLPYMYGHNHLGVVTAAYMYGVDPQRFYTILVKASALSCLVLVFYVFPHQIMLRRTRHDIAKVKERVLCPLTERGLTCCCQQR